MQLLSHNHVSGTRALRGCYKARLLSRYILTASVHSVQCYELLIPIPVINICEFYNSVMIIIILIITLITDNGIKLVDIGITTVKSTYNSAYMKSVHV